MTSSVEWMADHGIGGTDYFTDSATVARMRADQQDAADAAAEREREDAAAERREAREVAMYLGKVQPGAALSRGMAMADAEAEIRDHQEQIEKLERRLARYRREAADEAEALSRAHSMASRSASLDPAEAALQRARETHREFSRNTRAALSAAVVGRPKGAGDAVRADLPPVTCPDCIQFGATAEESWLLHADPQAPPGVALPAPTGAGAQRRGYAEAGEIRR